MTDRAGDDDWVRETLARAVLDEEPNDGERLTSSDPGARRIGDGAGSGSTPAAVEGPAGPTATGPTATGPTTAGPTDPASPGGVGDHDASGDGDSGHGDSGDGDSGDGVQDGASAVRSIVEWLVVIVGALAMALLLRAVLFQAFWIPSESMEPTLQRDDRVLVNRLSYRLHDVNRGDIVVFSRPPGEAEGGIRDLIKRVVALEGETIEGRDGQITVDGQLLLESYIAEGAPIPDFGPIVVPEDHVFVMGDNRNNSRDSRFFSAIDEDSIVGRAFVLFWPLNRIGAL